MADGICLNFSDLSVDLYPVIHIRSHCHYKRRLYFSSVVGMSLM